MVSKSACFSLLSSKLSVIFSLLLHLFSFVDNNRVEGSYQHLPTFEDEVVDELKSMVEGLVTKDFMKSNGYLLRWLQVYDFDLDLTYDKFLKCLEWRKEHNIDNILQENFTMIDEAYPYAVDGVDNDGRPIAWAPVGAYDVRKIALSGEEEMYQRYMMRMFELLETYLYQKQQETGQDNITQIIVIFDMGGFNVKTGACMRCLGMVPEFMSNVEKNYPNIFYKAYHVNTPSVFQNVFRIAKNFWSDRTREAVQVFDFNKDKWSAALLKQIPADQLPIKYGGTKHEDFVSLSHRRIDIIKQVLAKAEHRIGKDNLHHKVSHHPKLLAGRQKLEFEESNSNHMDTKEILPSADEPSRDEESNRMDTKEVLPSADEPSRDYPARTDESSSGSGMLEIEIHVPASLLTAPLSTSTSLDLEGHRLRHSKHHHHHYQPPPSPEPMAIAMTQRPPFRQSLRSQQQPRSLRSSAASTILTRSTSILSIYSVIVLTFSLTQFYLISSVS